MNNNLLSRFYNNKRRHEPGIPATMGWLIPGMALFSAVLLGAGYQLGLQRAETNGRAFASAEVEGLLERERLDVRTAQVEQRAHLDALALRIAKLQARIMRLDALGERLVGVGKLDSSEFDFASEPAQGGLGEDGDSSGVRDIIADLDRIERLFQDRASKLEMLETQLANRALIRESLPSGRPVDGGWVSSGFGRRIDPISGKRRSHHGIDFAAKEGSPVRAVAAGVVIESDNGSAYGNRIEIKHPDGYTTLYAHNEKNLVATGDVVAKGELIALLGSTGRSTGPHVHFEVRKQGQLVNPAKFIRAP